MNKDSDTVNEDNGDHIKPQNNEDNEEYNKPQNNEDL